MAAAPYPQCSSSVLSAAAVANTGGPSDDGSSDMPRVRYRAASGGAGAMTACAACGMELRENAKFCDECGSPVGWRTLAEYKQVTVLFADVVRSMEMASALDPERLREIMAELFDRSAAVVAHYGGTVDKFTGDGIMAVFGAPVSLEDHAFRACLAALEMQTTARQLAAEVERP